MESESGTPTEQRKHRLHWFTGRAHEVLDELADLPTWSLTPTQRGEIVREIVSVQARLQGHLLGLIADADREDDAALIGAVNTAAWVRATTGLTGPEARRLTRHATVVDHHDPTAQALLDGRVHTEQALAITTAVDHLPPEVTHLRDQAEQHMLDLAADHDAAALRCLGRHLLEVIAPDEADALIARELAAQEAEARKTAYLRTWSDGAGSRYGRFKIPELHALMLDAMLDAITNPARPHDTPTDGAVATTGQTTPLGTQADGQALCELIERYPVGKLPHTAGVTAQVVVTMTLETLQGGLQAAGVLGSPHRLSPGEARRLAASAGVIPHLLGSRSETLDLGRKRRLFTAKQRLALSLRQQGLCNIKGCDRPTTWADANHRHPWQHGGTTDLTNGELICPRHHTLIHQGFDYPRRT